MSPRRYTMTRKMALAAETRQRIVAATLILHGQNGIFGTSWRDIATEANVSVGTVYRYFPTLDQLVPACGELLMERVQPPQPESISDILGDATQPAERIKRVADALFAFYERGGSHLDADLRERELPAVREWEEFLRAMVAGFIGEALVGFHQDAKTIIKLSFLFDFPTFRAMRARGISANEASRIAAEMAIAWLGIRPADLTDQANRTP